MKKHLILLMGPLLLTACVSPKAVMRKAYEVRTLDERRPDSESALEFRARIVQAYDRLLAAEVKPQRLARLDAGALTALFGGVSAVFFYSEEPAALTALESVFTELERRGTATDAQTRELYNDYLIGRRPNQARRLAERRPFPGLAEPPRFEEDPDLLATAGERAYDVSPDGGMLRLTRLQSKRGPRIIMLASPNCAPSIEASRAIESDPRLRRAFADHAWLLNAPSLSLSPGDIARWNARHPDLKSKIAYSRRDWPSLNLGVTPVFYLFREGRLIRAITGWTPASREALDEGLREAGLE